MGANGTRSQQQKQFNAEITGLRFVDPGKIVVATGAHLFLWNLLDKEPVELTGHSHPIKRGPERTPAS